MAIKYKMEIQNTLSNNTVEKIIIEEFSVNGYMPSKIELEDYFYEIAKDQNINLLPRDEDQYFTSLYHTVNYQIGKYSNSAFIETRLPETENSRLCLFVEEEKRTKARL